MNQDEKKSASVEYVAEMVGKLTVNFYETPEKLFDALTKTILFLKMTEYEVNEMVNDAIFTIKKTKITIADVINGREERPKKILPYTFD
jgi:predicted nucleic acid-binding protein